MKVVDLLNEFYALWPQGPISVSLKKMPDKMRPSFRDVMNPKATVELIKQIKDRDVDIVAIDSHDKKWTDRKIMGAYDPRNKTYIDIKVMTHVNALKKYKTNVLMMVWPDYQSLMATEATQRFRGDKIVYIGDEPPSRGSIHKKMHRVK